MKVLKPLALGILTRPLEFRRTFYLSVAAISFCPMGAPPALLGEVAMWKFLPEVLPAGQPLDLGMPKTAAEFLVAGNAFAPGGQPVQALTATARLGAVSRRIGLVGDRHIENGLPTDPLPFTEMPMGWDRAYGGPKFAQNPLGRGMAEVPIPGLGYRVALPNLVAPQGAPAPRTPEPLNFGPIDIAWPQRASLAGTHDQRWLEEEFPGFARDTDWRMFMAAQPEQRFSGFLAGDEDYAIANMHPAEAEITGRLPGIQPRILVRRQGSEVLEDVPLSLTTVWFFPAHKRLVMIHHGRVRVAEEDARDISHLLLGADRLGTPRPVAAFAEAMARRLAREDGMFESLNEAALVPSEFLVEDPEIAAALNRHKQEGRLAQRIREKARRADEAQRARMLAGGVKAEQLPPPPDLEPEPMPDVAALPAFLRRKKAEADEERKAKEAEAEVAAARLEAGGGKRVDAQARPSGPPRVSAVEQRARMEQKIAALEASGQDAASLRAMMSDPAQAKRLEEMEKVARDGYRNGADRQDSAPRLDAAANEAVRARLLDGRRGGPRLDLCGADLAGLDLSGFDLTEAWLDGADLTGTDLSKAKLARAVLAHARLSGAKLVGADLEGANLGRAALSAADLTGARLRDAVLRGADLRQARLCQADLTGVQLHEAILEGADISGAQAPRFIANEASLVGLRAAGAALQGATFIKAALDGADFSGANLTSATFVGARGERVGFQGATLDKAAFVQECALPGARFMCARCIGTNLRGTLLDGAAFDGAILDQSDFADCRLQGASFDLVRARRARFTVADLRGARMTRADLAGADLARSDVRGADLSDSSLYEADVARIHADAATRYERIQRTRVRIHPRRTPE